VIKYQASKEPTTLVIDNAPVHIAGSGDFDPFSKSTSKKNAIEYLKAQPPDSDLGMYWASIKKPDGDSKVKREEILGFIQSHDDKRLTGLELLLAEIGIRKFGVPHRVLFTPPRMPEYQPVELFGHGKKTTSNLTVEYGWSITTPLGQWESVMLAL